ncbi:enkurin [Arctopsyche grandis]|uniref:enkurin n=1 Tax=Arctopsyche grandis TaxID=121162 RepID=UPI00406DA381
MSIVKIVNHDERICDILYKPPPPDPKPPRHVSRYRKLIEPPKDKKDYAAMGVAKLTIEGPGEFLKKGDGVKKPSIEGHKQCLADGPLPKLPDRVTTGAKRTKIALNFVERNVKSAQSLQPRPPEKFLVDSPDGHKYLLQNKDMKLLYSDKFGAVPQYLIKRNDYIRKAEDKYRKKLENREHACKMIGEGERVKILKGLKDNWSAIQKSFLRLPLFIDTVYLVNKKKKCEDELRELEKYIKFLEENPYIYIYDDDD